MIRIRRQPATPRPGPRRRFGPPAARLACLLICLLATVGVAQVLSGSKASDPDDGLGLDPELQAAIAKNQSDLSQLQEELTAAQRRLEQLDDREAEVRRGRDQVQDEVALTRRLLAEMNERERMLTTKRQALQEQLAANGKAHAQQKAVLARSLRAWYVRGQADELQLLLTANSFSDLITSLKYNAMLARLNGGLIERTRGQARQIVRQQKELDGSLVEIWEGRQTAAEQQANLELLEAENIALLRELADERGELKDRLLELSLNEQKLNYILGDLEQMRLEKAALDRTAGAETTAAASLVDLAGKLEWPVDGEILRGFGRSVHPRFGTVTVNNGLNIGARAGAPVAAVAVGAVEFADQLPGYGRCVILDHGAGYYTLYAHLDQVFVAPGAQIARGQVIAEVGRPAGGEPAQLYFEVRHGRTPLDPADWLRSH